MSSSRRHRDLKPDNGVEIVVPARGRAAHHATVQRWLLGLLDAPELDQAEPEVAAPVIPIRR